MTKEQHAIVEKALDDAIAVGQRWGEEDYDRFHKEAEKVYWSIINHIVRTERIIATRRRNWDQSYYIAEGISAELWWHSWYAAQLEKILWGWYPTGNHTFSGRHLRR